MIIDYVIRNAESESAIYFLLAAYIETTQFGERLPEYLTNLPITGMEDVETRFQQLMMECDKASERLPNKSGAIIEEALHIFDDALCRLKVLEHAHPGRCLSRPSQNTHSASQGAA
ncbi:MAG: hypothetical protein HYU73_16745 [Betaproteobacteria bacterium]|nr:hypothetical protein [Betaproteobacteria bacterium]MBI3052850.1 hypothetical protein [Betaproteobacteria bacterium]